MITRNPSPFYFITITISNNQRFSCFKITILFFAPTWCTMRSATTSWIADTVIIIAIYIVSIHSYWGVALIGIAYKFSKIAILDLSIAYGFIIWIVKSPTSVQSSLKSCIISPASAKYNLSVPSQSPLNSGDYLPTVRWLMSQQTRWNYKFRGVVIW